MTIALTRVVVGVEDVIRHLGQAVATGGITTLAEQRPDASGYFGYRYVWNGQPDCLIARTLHLATVPVEVLADCEGMDVRQLRHVVAGECGLELTDGAVEVLERVRVAQDWPEPWGDVLVDAAKMGRRVLEAGRR